MTDRVFYFATAGFVVGIFFRSFVNIGPGFPWFLVLMGAAVFARLFLRACPPFGSRWGGKLETSPPAGTRAGFTKGGIITAVFLVAVGLGILRYDQHDQGANTSSFFAYVGTTVQVEGVISDEPDVREATTQLRLRTKDTTLLLVAPHEPTFRYGDRVRVEGKLERPKNFVDEKTLREVDYVAQLEKDGVYFEIFRPKLTLVVSGEGNMLIEGLFAFKNAFIANINSLIPQPHAALLGGLVVGAKQSLGKELLEDFRTVGVIHIVVLSGYNITIIAVFIEWLLSRLRKNVRLILAAVGMILFSIMVGASATVIRATVMALLVLLAHGTGRIYAVTRALLVAGVIMLLHNPKILAFDTSFQLSFLATLGLIYVSPFVLPRVKWVTEFWHFREIVVATVATQVFVLPFLLYKTGMLSLISLPVNLLILAAIPLTMLFGFLAGMLAFVSAAVAIPFAYIAYALLSYELGVVEWFARIPGASASVSHFPLALMLLWYALYAILFLAWRIRNADTGIRPSEGPLQSSSL